MRLLSPATALKWLLVGGAAAWISRYKAPLADHSPKIHHQVAPKRILIEGELPLNLAETGRPLRLVCINGGRKLTHRLAELGLTPGVTFTIIHDAGGPLLISVRGSRVALGHDLAQRIQVQSAL